VQQDARFFLVALPRHEITPIAVSEFPGLANLAGLIEMFGMSKRELDAKFTKSELFILAWRSQEQSWKLEESMHKNGNQSPAKGHHHVEGTPAGLPDKFFNKEGEVDLRQVTGREAYKYFSAMGLKFPIMTRE
jgi:hypothetical protein